MPMRKVYQSKAKKAAKGRKRQFTGYTKKRSTNRQSQVFSETYKAGTECQGVNAQGEVFVLAGQQGTGIKLMAQLNRLPQASDYRNLYRAYKVLKVKYTIIPKFTAEAFNDANIAALGGLGAVENRRFCYAINDLDQNVTTAPTTETEVLQANGCRVKLFSKPVKITHRPRPVAEVTAGAIPSAVNTWTKQNPWIEFDGVGPTVQHMGVDGYFSVVNGLTSGFIAIADVYTTITFVCKDPR